MIPNEAGERSCSATGLRLIPARGETAYRVAKDRGRPALEGFPNTEVGALRPGTIDRRGRWDTIGSTLYLADSPQTAFAEVLAPLRINRERLRLAAERSGYTDVDTYANEILHQAVENDVDRPWAISCRWQFARSIYQLTLPSNGWWVRIDHPDTLLAAQEAGRTTPGLTTDIWSGDIEGSERAVTTLIAEYIRGVVLDDGSRPLGIEYRSRTLIGRCYAWWDRRGDDGLPPGADDPRLEHSTNVDTPALREIAATFGLPVLEGRLLR